MEEDPNEHDLEERLYAMLHHVDHSQNNLSDSHQKKFDFAQYLESYPLPQSTVRRYWHSEPDTNIYQKINTPKDIASAAPKIISTLDNNIPKEEKNTPPKAPSPVDLSIFQSPIPQNAKKIIEYQDHEDNSPVVLESSDEDEVVEIALPPKPTITIESSDEDDLHIIKPKSTNCDPKANSEHKSNCGERAVSSSPVPSVVSSISDEFIRSDCIALNISSRHPDKHSFDFSLHGSDLLVLNTPSKKKKRKKNKEAVTSTPVKPVAAAEGCFATPKSKAKNKKQKSKLLAEKSITNLDVYDSDSNPSIVNSSKNKNLYIVTEKSLPSADVYESDSNQSEIVKENNTDQCKNKEEFVAYSSDSSVSNDKPEEPPKSLKKSNGQLSLSLETVDLTDNDSFITIDNTICESIVMGNVTGLSESMDHGDESRVQPNIDISKYVSSKVPSILNEDLDFDNLKGKEKICKRRPYSLTTLRAEMEKFYNESWGGEDFDHREIQKNMSRDKNLWAIDPKDRMPSLGQRRVKCSYCNRAGHRDDTCRLRPLVCYMCGNTGHFESRCPRKICVNCGAPNFMYSTACRNCSSWAHTRCAECGQAGHPASHCPDVWRRYHNTTDTNVSLEMCTQPKKVYQLYCSGCSKRGHLAHSCRVTLPYSGHPINSPYVHSYRPVLQTPGDKRNKTSQDSTVTLESTPQRLDRNKRRSKSPTLHETHSNKKRHLSLDNTELDPKSPVTQKTSPAKDVDGKCNKRGKSLDSAEPEKAPDFISITSSNHDKKGHVIQDNEVSDTSDAVTSARIYVTSDIIQKLKAKNGEEWLKATVEKLDVVVEQAEIKSFLTIKGKLADQESFQSELREWTQSLTQNRPIIPKTPSDDVNNSQEHNNQVLNNIPKNRNNLLRQLSRALDSLKMDQGDPKALYKELTFSQGKHEKLLKQKAISPAALSNSRTHINEMLKKLNIVLLGQAGLADGMRHVNILFSFKEKLMHSRQKTISQSVRSEIGKHYHTIFSPSARDDYGELMKKYYFSVSTSPLSKKSKHKQVQPSSNTTQFCKNNSIPPQESREHVAVTHTPSRKISPFRGNKKANLQRKLVSYYDRLSSLKQNSKVQKEIPMIVRRLHSFLGMLHKNQNLSSKQIKKIYRVQDQAKKFLADV